MSGWIKMHRKVKDHWIYSKPEYFYWWFDILSEVNFKDKKLVIGETLFICKRGESLLSMVSWANRWNVNRSKVIRFFKLLESDDMIVLKNEHLTTRLTVCNYEAYQLNENEVEHQMNTKRTPNEHQVNTIKEVKKEKNNNKRKLYFEDAKKVELKDVEEWVKKTAYSNKCPKALFTTLQKWIANDWVDFNGKEIKSTWKAKLTGSLSFAPDKPKRGNVTMFNEPRLR